MDTAYVNLWNKRVGAILWDPERSIGIFEYEPDFVRYGWDISPFMVPIEQEGNRFSFPDLVRTSTFDGLPGLLSDSLPDKFGNSLIDAWLLKNGRPAGSLNPVEKLCFVGKRGMGALEFEPVVPKSTDNATKLEISELIETAGEILRNRESFISNLKKDEEKALADILKIGTSAGGARAKALIAFNEETSEVRSGQSDAPKGFQHWLFKFDGVHDTQFGETYGFGRVEMAYYLMAISCGIEMTECRLYEENGRAHFMTKRFDRVPGKGKAHVQSFCAMRHFDFQDIASYQYEQLFDTMRGLGLPYPQAEQLFRRMVFNVLARNCDDHTKNFAFIMDKDGLWSLAPAFDVCHAYRPGSTWVSRHCLSVNGKRENITRDDFLTVAAQMNIKKASTIIDEVKNAVNKWDKFASEVEVESRLANGIKSTHLVL